MDSHSRTRLPVYLPVSTLSPWVRGAGSGILTRRPPVVQAQGTSLKRWATRCDDGGGSGSAVCSRGIPHELSFSVIVSMNRWSLFGHNEDLMIAQGKVKGGSGPSQCSGACAIESSAGIPAVGVGSKDSVP